MCDIIFSRIYEKAPAYHLDGTRNNHLNHFMTGLSIWMKYHFFILNGSYVRTQQEINSQVWQFTENWAAMTDVERTFYVDEMQKKYEEEFLDDTI